MQVATETSPAAAPASAPPARLLAPVSSRYTVLVLALAGALGSAIVLHALAQPHGLYGIVQYDDGVNFASSLRLVSGQLAYHDFVFLQPPGITILFAPFAALAHVVGTSDALGAARIFTAVVAGANALLAGLLVRHRGVVAAGAAALVVAVFPPAFFADRTVMLEPYLALACLIGANLVFHRGELAGRLRLVLGGVAFGVGASVKLFGVVPIVVLGLFLLRRPLRQLLPYAAGVTVGFAAIALPFFVAAPHAFWHDIVSAQLARAPAGIRSRSVVRLWNMTGLRGASAALPVRLHSLLPTIVGAFELAFLVLAGVVPTLLRKGDRAERFCLAAGGAVIVAMLIPPEFYAHYVYFEIAFIGPAIGCCFARIAHVTGQVVTGRVVAGRPQVLRRVAIGSGAVAVAGVLVAAGFLVDSMMHFEAAVTVTTGNPMTAIEKGVPKGACVVTDAVILTVESSRFFAAKPGCPSLIDSSGEWLALDPNHPPRTRGARDPQLVAKWRRWFAASDYVLLSQDRSFRVPWTPALTAWFAAHFQRIPPLALYKRVAPGASAATVRRAAAG